MERPKILNPLTGRMVYADGVVAKSIPKMKKKVSLLEGAVKRTGTTKIAEKKEAVGKLSGAIKRKLTKKPEPPPPPQPRRVYGWEDLPDDVKDKISAIVKKNRIRDFNNDDRIILNKTTELDERDFDDFFANGITPVKIVREYKNQLHHPYKTYFKTYTRRDRVRILSKVSKDELDRLGGLYYYPLVCVWIDDLDVSLWCFGDDADELISRISTYYDGHILLPDGNILYYDENDPEPFIGDDLFGNKNMPIDLQGIKIYDIEDSMLPPFSLPNITQNALNEYFDDYFDGSYAYTKGDWNDIGSRSAGSRSSGSRSRSSS